MILAIIERIENLEKQKPFHKRYFLTQHYKEIWDELDVLLFPVISEKNLEKVCELCDGLIVTGSAIDIPPKYYQEKPQAGKTYDIDEFKLDKKAITLFWQKQKPILGICGGMQSINVCFGGSLNQQIENHDLKNELHAISIKENSFLHKTYDREKIQVNSFHHQSVKKVAEVFCVTAYAEDGTIEAIEKDNMIGVQWHPEEMKDLRFFENFIKMSQKRVWNEKEGKNGK